MTAGGKKDQDEHFISSWCKDDVINRLNRQERRLAKKNQNKRTKEATNEVRIK